MKWFETGKTIVRLCGVLTLCVLLLGPGGTPISGAWQGAVDVGADAGAHALGSTIASIERVGNDADESVTFTLDGCTAMRLYAVGEGSDAGMQDYGSIERADTGQVIWQMRYHETEADGWLTNLRVDRSMSLPAGAYRLRFRTNSAHAYDDWGGRAPEDPFWGIALYRDTSAGASETTCWTYADRPEDLGWSSRRLARLDPILERMDVAAFMIVTDGQVVYEWGPTAVNYQAHSMRKSLLSALYGIAVGEGTIDPSATLASLGIDDKTPLTEAEKQATVGDLLKARSGVYIQAAGEAASMVAKRPERGSHAPGTFWYYNNWDFNALGTIYDQETGAESIYQAFEETIAEPLGMQDLDITRLHYRHEPQSMHPYYGFRISARDLARFGQLYLQGGAWQGRQIVPGAWVQESTTAHSRADDGGTYSGYGTMWWVAAKDCWGITRGSYDASGYGGHTVAVLPEINTVIVVRVDTDDPRSRHVDTDKVDALIAKALIASDRVQGAERAGGLCAERCAGVRGCGYQAYYTEMVRLPRANAVLLAWGAGVALSLAALAWGLARRSPMPWVSRIAWVLVVLVYGPLGLLALWGTVRERNRASPWLPALGATLHCVAGSIIALVALIAAAMRFAPTMSLGPLALLGPLLVGWLAFRGPLAARWMGTSYWVALRRTLLVEAITTCLALAGILPVATALANRWRPCAGELGSALFWLSFLIGAAAGALLVYPFNAWMAHHRFLIWPLRTAGEGTAGLPALRNAWWALLVSVCVLVSSMVFVS